MEIILAAETDMPIVRSLFREYQSWLNVAICFQGFEEELAYLPGRYAAPKGAIYLAMDKSNAVGCAAIRSRIDRETEAELKRLFVHQDYRGKGIGKKLFQTVMDRTEEMGYSSMVLETLPIMKAARSLYAAYGFRPIQAYFEDADDSVEFYRYTF